MTNAVKVTIEAFRKNKLNVDIAWTMGSLVILAASGILINLIIAGLRDAAALGIFNLAYAVYIVASQIAVFGLHYSVMRHAALYEAEHEVRSSMFFTAAVCATLLGAVFSLLVFVAAPAFGRVFDSTATSETIRFAAVGLLLFPLNKVLIAYLNGMRHMKAFSVLQSCRYLLVMVWVAVVSVSERPFEYVGVGFIVAEAVTTIAALLYITHAGLAQSRVFVRDWVLRHFSFGGRSLLAGMFVELNSRVDVLLIGFFLPERAVGIYSFAAMLIDGLYHVLAMIRINFNPVLVGAVRDSRWAEAQHLMQRARRTVYPAAAGLALVALLAFSILAVYVVPDKGLLEGLPALMILLVGLAAIAAYVPFDNLLLASGHPGFQTLQHLAVVGANVILNIALVPVFGITGAAVATACSYLVGMAMLFALVRRFLGWNLLSNMVVN